MSPFLCDTIFAKKSTNPLNLIILAKEAAIFFDTSQQGIAHFNNVSARDRTTAFSIWAFTIHLGQLSKVHHAKVPNNATMQTFCDNCHRACIHSPLHHALTNMTNPGENLEVPGNPPLTWYNSITVNGLTARDHANNKVQPTGTVPPAHLLQHPQARDHFVGIQPWQLLSPTCGGTHNPPTKQIDSTTQMQTISWSTPVATAAQTPRGHLRDNTTIDSILRTIKPIAVP